MEKEKEDCTIAPRLVMRRKAILHLPVVILFCLLLGCAAPGEPLPRKPPIPEAIIDLAARQSGDGVVLTFTLPRNTTEHQRLAEPPVVEIFRGAIPAGAEREKLSTRLVYTIPAALVESYVAEGRMRFVDPLRPEEPAQMPGGQMVYLVRTRASKRRASADSNVVAVRVYPAPERIRDLRAAVTETAVELSWTRPGRTTAGAPLASVAGYRVYRAELEPGAEAAPVEDVSKTKLKAPLELLAPAAAPEFRDTQLEFGRTYLYVVRSVAQYESDSVESGDSLPAVVTPRDVFPPAEPKDLVGVGVPATPQTRAHIELSWSISPETDWAGYYIYRTVENGTQAERLTRELLLSPTFRDMSVLAGRRYRYQVTAVDRAGNEGPRSAAVTAEVPRNEP